MAPSSTPYPATPPPSQCEQGLSQGLIVRCFSAMPQIVPKLAHNRSHGARLLGPLGANPVQDRRLSGSGRCEQARKRARLRAAAWVAAECVPLGLAAGAP